MSDPAANPSQVIAAQRQVVTAARHRFDVVLLDTAPLLTANDAVEMVASADLIVLVARSEVTTFDSGRRAAETLSRLDAPLGGVVLTAVKGTSNDYYYYYQPGRAESGAHPPVTPNGDGAEGNGKGATGSAADQVIFGTVADQPLDPTERG